MTIASEIKVVEQEVKDIADNLDKFDYEELDEIVDDNFNQINYLTLKKQLETLKFAQSEMEAELKKQREEILFDCLAEGWEEQSVNDFNVEYVKGIQFMKKVINKKLEELTN